MYPFGVGVVRGPSAGREGKPRTHGGRRPRSSRGRCYRWLSHGRARTRSCGGLQDLADLLVEEVVLAVDAVAVDGEQDRDAVPGPGDDLGGVPAQISHSALGAVAVPDDLNQVAFWIVCRNSDGPTGNSQFTPIAILIRPDQ